NPGTTTGSGASLAVSAVPSPLDASAFRDAPCDLISERQAGELGLPVVQEERSGGRVACTWRAETNDPNPLEALSIRVQTASGLGAIAQQCSSRTECDSWTVDTISDYPVIRANGQLESKYGRCRLFVGVADNVAFLVTDGDLDAVSKGATEGDAGGPRCDRADQAATIAIQTLKEGR
ncbi:MAG: DUF3558 domain-containing protein, partial [Pseudonocardiaceae bacterium]|nr:DUF3558 domain-containing protein [Pseudonocardiaceae bacterium]